MRLKTIFVSFLVLVLAGCAVSSKDVKRAKAAGIPIVIGGAILSGPDSAGGVGAQIFYKNTSEKTFKYIVFTVLPFNNVGDVAPSVVGGKTAAYLREVGPIKPGQGVGYGSGSHWSDIWYNYSIRCLKFMKVKITYMSGKTETFAGSRLYKVLGSGFQNSCKAQ